MQLSWEAFRPWQTITVVSAAAFLMEALSLLTAFHALRRVRTSQAAVAWVVGLITLPLIALPLYWMFARHRFSGYREAIREVGLKYQCSVASIRRELSTDVNVRSTGLGTPLEHVADVLDTPISKGNRFRLLVDGDRFFEALFDRISRAERYVYAAFYIVRDDELGNRFADALIERAERGVIVRLMYDEVGCIRLSASYLRRLTEAGVEVRAFDTRQGWVNRFQINFRNHRKLVIIDGVTTIVGGLNVGNEYLGRNAGSPNWRDTGIEVVGPCTRKVQAVFAGDYYWAARTDLPEAVWGPSPRGSELTDADRDDHDAVDHDAVDHDAVDHDAVDRGVAAVCATGPADPRPRASMMFAAAAGTATKRLWISTPYLVPDESTFVSLHMAKARGVDVRILIPDQADQLGVYLAGFHYERQFAEAGIPVYRYHTGFLHQKCVLVDDALALIGSTNLDNRSLHLNFELMVAVEDRELVREVASMLETDFSNARLGGTSDTPARWWFSRVGTAVARLFSPVL